MRKVMNWKGFLLLSALMLTAFFVLYLVLENTKSEIQLEENTKNVALTNLQAENRALLAELETVGTNAYIENSARTNYNFVQKGEIRFEITNPEALYAYTAEEIQILMEELAD